MSTLQKDPDVITPDDPDEMQPDHDESLNPHLVPDSDPLWVPDSAGIQTFTHMPVQRELASVTSGAPNVAFPREIHKGFQGEDILAHKRAISRARPDLYEWTNFTDVAGGYFIEAVQKWKKSKGLGSTPVLGGRAHEVLERTHRKDHADQWAFDQIAIKQAQDYYDSVTISPEDRIRAAGVAAGFFWYAHKWNIPYSMFRPMALGKPPYVLPRIDCSGFATNCHYAGGGKDPNRRGYDHLGYTGTLISNGTRVLKVTMLKPLDLIFYGFSREKPGFRAGDPTHVAVYVGFRDGAHMILSMGSYPMKYVRYDYRSDINHFRHYDVAA
jgi:cell wall-associated NlpC family hydrolase